MIIDIGTSNHMFMRAIWDKLPEHIFENFEIALLKLEESQNFSKRKQFQKPNIISKLSPKSPKPNMWLLVNHIKFENNIF